MFLKNFPICNLKNDSHKIKFLERFLEIPQILRSYDHIFIRPTFIYNNYEGVNTLFKKIGLQTD